MNRLAIFFLYFSLDPLFTFMESEKFQSTHEEKFNMPRKMTRFSPVYDTWRIFKTPTPNENTIFSHCIAVENFINW